MKEDKKSDLRSMVKMMLEDKELGPAMLKVNPVVDPSAALTDPGNADFKPRSPAELKAALIPVVDDIPHDQIPSIYDRIIHALDNSKEEQKVDTKMNKNKVEEAVRLMVRKLLREADAPGSRSTLRSRFVKPENPPFVLGRFPKEEEILGKKMPKAKYSASTDPDEPKEKQKPRQKAPELSPEEQFKKNVKWLQGRKIFKQDEEVPEELKKKSNSIDNLLKIASDSIKIPESHLRAYVVATVNALQTDQSLKGPDVVSSSSFSKSFKKEAGKTFNEYVLELGEDAWRALGASGSEKRGYNKKMGKTSKEISGEVGVSQAQVNKDVLIGLGKALIDFQSEQFALETVNSSSASEEDVILSRDFLYSEKSEDTYEQESEEDVNVDSMPLMDKIDYLINSAKYEDIDDKSTISWFVGEALASMSVLAEQDAEIFGAAEGEKEAEVDEEVSREIDRFESDLKALAAEISPELASKMPETPEGSIQLVYDMWIEMQGMMPMSSHFDQQKMVVADFLKKLAVNDPKYI